MKKELLVNGLKIEYELQYKKVKNINLRIRTDGSVYVSANKRVSQTAIENFIGSKADFIQNALKRYAALSAKPRRQYFTEDEVRGIIIELCGAVYPYFKARGVKYPQIKFRKMVSRWGSCQPTKGILTFNTNLMYAPKECIEYVVAHEFTHFLQANHSDKFYKELEKICPDRKMRQEQLKEIIIY